MLIRPATLAWHDGQPRSLEFDDIYFSADGITEAQRVFIDPSDIINLASKQACVCIAELGFGTGLNFATVAQQILHKTNARLRFISFEKHPLKIADWQKVVAARGRELPIYDELNTQPLSLVPGWQQRVLAAGRVILTVYHGDVEEGLIDLVTRQKNPVDAWFLDGFAPSKNPAMWTNNIYSQIAATAGKATMLATFTAAGHVRRGLAAVGFEMRKVDQQPFKRESLAGRFVGSPARQTMSPTAKINIYGAGLGGACMARYIAEHGVDVHVYDPRGTAQSASAIDAAIMHARLLSDGTVDAEFRVSSFHFASNYLKRFAGFTQTGVLQVKGPNLSQTKLEKLCRAYDANNTNQHDWLQNLSAQEASTRGQVKLSDAALYFPTAGVIDVPSLCSALLNHPRIHLSQTAPPINSDATNIICAAGGTREFPGCSQLEITEVWGQLDWYSTTAPVSRMPVVGNGYLVPTEKGCVLGATYEKEEWLTAVATKHNIDMNAHYLADRDISWQRAVRGARAVTSDRVPIIGQLTNDTCALWLATAFGSMGTTAAPLAAAIVGSTILGWLAPTQPSILNLTRPLRFAERQARRGKLQN